MRRHSAVSLPRLVADALMAILAVALAYQLRYRVYPGDRYIPGDVPPDPAHYAWATPVLGVTVLVVFAVMGAYRSRRGVQFVDELFSLTGAMAVTTLVALAMIGVYRETRPGGLVFTYSRLTLVYWAVTATVLIAIARYVIRRYAASRWARGIGADRALLVGWNAAADLLVQRLRMFPDYGYRLIGILTDRLEPGTEVGGVRVIGRVEDMGRVVRNRDVDVVFMALSDVDQERTLQLLDECRASAIDFRILPSMLELMTTSVTADQIDGIPLLQLRHGIDISGYKTVLKRIFDLTAAGLGLVLISPLLALLALLVKLSSPGPVLLHQERLGMRGRRFRMHKFRSMRTDAEADSGPVWAEVKDPRRTPVGRVLRRLSLDELPQLWNILRGEMSLVGPRAERPSFAAEFAERLSRYPDRHLVRPGLAGWAQANDLRGQTPVEERLVYDLYYIENWSLAFDLKIILITVARVWTHKNAY